MVAKLFEPITAYNQRTSTSAESVMDQIKACFNMIPVPLLLYESGLRFLYLMVLTCKIVNILCGKFASDILSYKMDDIDADKDEETLQFGEGCFLRASPRKFTPTISSAFLFNTLTIEIQQKYYAKVYLFILVSFCSK